MIKKLESIKDFGVFRNFYWDQYVLDKNGVPLEFADVNIIYGQNYSGKTTISRILRSLETKELPDNFADPRFVVSTENNGNINQDQLSDHNLEIRVFNNDFIQKNLKFLYDPDKDISAFALLGKDNHEIDQEIKELQENLGSSKDGEESGLYKDLKEKKALKIKNEKNYSDAQKNLTEKLRNKATNRETGIKYQPNKFGDQNYTIAKLRHDIEFVLSDEYKLPNFDKINKLESTINMDAKSDVDHELLSDFGLEQFVPTIKELLAREIGSSNKIGELLRDNLLNKWVKEGMNLNFDRDTCGFCGNTLSDKRWKELNAHFDEESKRLSDDILACITRLEQEQQQIEIAVTIDKNQFYSFYHDRLDTISIKLTEEIKIFSGKINTLIQQLKRKQERLTSSMQIVIPNTNYSNLEEQLRLYKNICDEQSDYTLNLEEEKKEAMQALRLREVYDFQSNIYYSSYIKNVQKLEEAKTEANDQYEKLLEEIKNKEDRISVLKNQLRDEGTAANLINDYLVHYFGHNSLSLRPIGSEEGEVTKFEIIRDNKKAYNLSEGECSLIAFCYFMAKLSDISEKGDNLIVWIDDPISSLDSNHVFFIYSLVKSEIIERKRCKQLFISTHSLSFLRYLKRIHVKGTSMYFLLKRIGQESTLQIMPDYLKKHVTEFNFLFSEIYQCSKPTHITDDNYDKFYNFGNNARKFLEILLYYYYPDDCKEIEKYKRFFGDSPVPSFLVGRLSNEYSHLKANFERGEQPVDVPEMQTVAKLIVDTLKSRHPEQYEALLKSIGEDASSAS
ncbi:MAG: AAA family ATPase [Bacillota bacterium]|nr:AAA family ATPase [Bacillota bacterium]